MARKKVVALHIGAIRLLVTAREVGCNRVYWSKRVFHLGDMALCCQRPRIVSMVSQKGNSGPGMSIWMGP